MDKNYRSYIITFYHIHAKSYYIYFNMGLLMFALFSIHPSLSMACVGARPLGMGGAFIAVADDANVPYWNPAALALMQKRQATGMFTADDDINYKNFVSYSQALDDQFAAAASIYTWRDRFLGYLPQGDPLILENYSRPWVSLAYRMSTARSGTMALGANLSFGQGKLARPMRNIEYSTKIGVGLDLSFLYRHDKHWSFGLLIQDINEPSIESEELGYKIDWMRNVRPGVAYRPNEQLLIAFDVYDFFDEELRKLMLGVEYDVDEEWSVRGGIYGLSEIDWPTVGGTYRFNPDFSLEASLMDFEVFILSATYAF